MKSQNFVKNKLYGWKVLIPFEAVEVGGKGGGLGRWYEYDDPPPLLPPRAAAEAARARLYLFLTGLLQPTFHACAKSWHKQGLRNFFSVIFKYYFFLRCPLFIYQLCWSGYLYLIWMRIKLEKNSKPWEQTLLVSESCVCVVSPPPFLVLSSSPTRAFPFPSSLPSEGEGGGRGGAIQLHPFSASPWLSFSVDRPWFDEQCHGQALLIFKDACRLGARWGK